MTTSNESVPARSRSRGRDLYSTGRGGVGNIQRSLSRDTGAPRAHVNAHGATDSVDTISTAPTARGRDSLVKGVDGGDEYVVHIGRGGAGNVRSVSRARDSALEAAESQYERSVIEHHEEQHTTFSTGRGGAGNIVSPELSPVRSHSRTASVDRVGRNIVPGVSTGPPSAERSQSRGRPPHSTGRGGAGNIHVGDLHEALEEIEEDKVLARNSSEPHPHSTGRGGVANVTALPSPPLEGQHPHLHHNGEDHAVLSMGRGGAGNIRDRSASASRSRTREHGHGHGHTPSALGKFMDVITGTKHGEKS